MKISFKILMIIVLIASACETVVDIQIPVEPPQIVVNSTLSDGEYIKVNLTESQHILAVGNPPPVEGAIVEIYEEGTLLTTLPDSLNGNYISNEFKPIRGKSYQVKATKIGFRNVCSKVKMPLDSVPILAVRVDSIIVDDFGYKMEYVRFSVDFKDDENLKNYYAFSIYGEHYRYIYDYNTEPYILIDSILETSLLYIETNDPTLEEYQSYGQNIYFDDEFFNGSSYTMNLLYLENYFWPDDLPYQSPSTYKIQLSNTSESHYLYGLSTQLQIWTFDNPFAQPVTVYNNIENGFGIFGAYNTSVYKVE